MAKVYISKLRNVNCYLRILLMFVKSIQSEVVLFVFYDILKELCKVNNTNVTRLISVLHLSTGNLSGWKNGAIPKSDTIKKIAEYFNVTTDYLLGNENVSETDTNKKMRSPEDERILDLLKTDESIVSYVKALANLPPEARKQAADYIELLVLKDKEVHHE